MPKKWIPPKDMILNGYLNFRSDKGKGGAWLPNYEIIVYKDHKYDRLGRPTKGDRIVLTDKAGIYYQHEFTLREDVNKVTMGQPKEHLRCMMNNGLTPTAPQYRNYDKHKVRLKCTGKYTSYGPIFEIM